MAGAAGIGGASPQGGAAGGPATGSEAQKQLIRNCGKSWSESLPMDERGAVNDYTGAAYANINATLRGIESEFDPGNRERAIAIHRALGRAAIPQECVVYRGVSKAALGDKWQLSDAELVGQKISDRGFMSTSLNRGDAFSQEVLLIIEVPQGTHGAYVGHISAAKHYESEVLIDAGQTMRILDVQRDEQGRRVLRVRIMQ